jgi:catechol 2,3-dioxygenase-like lactoylglutathione lyase family enzyme
MRLLRLDQVQLAIPESGEAEARRFYADALGLREAPKPPNLARRGGVWFEGGEGLRIHLGVEPDFRPARKAHPAFVVSGLRELAADLRARGFAVAADEPLEGFERFYVSDPFGNRVELMEPTSSEGCGAPCADSR